MTAALNNAQLEILQLFAADLSAEELDELRRMLIEFRYRRLQLALDKMNLSPAQIEAWRKGHDRTPYRSMNTKNESA